ncbi:TPA: hypothetical protein I8190_004549 [Citrobacter freundii]|uniref:hypothetical protein n=1 Tax=Citrobacter TaxID=544 RepID=UPI0019066411|nr:hypothetical protein [Citrobacter amalonaticus]HAT2287605.1 hypothetical protein [Citrobacter freundii]HCB1459333.1 hypothetical protein [Citrobacter farmeri]MBJ9275285.1 hypothetical protein [Citrobacter amalonaticus]HAT2351737.1 hypothetical protein [Citrobacter freundii]HAT2433274.1 hypothetical protein [Citrobacter freundii]
MGNQSKPGIYGASSTHKVKKAQRGGFSLSQERFLALKETKDWIDLHPDAVRYIDGECYLSRELSLLYLHLCGNKKIKKEFRKSTMDRSGV